MFDILAVFRLQHPSTIVALGSLLALGGLVPTSAALAAEIEVETAPPLEEQLADIPSASEQALALVIAASAGDLLQPDDFPVDPPLVSTSPISPFLVRDSLASVIDSASPAATSAPANDEVTLALPNAGLITATDDAATDDKEALAALDTSLMAGAVPTDLTTPDTATPMVAPVLAQVTVDELSDVQPTDWAFQAVQSLTEQYNCLAGYPDGTFRGNSSMTRYEFAAALNACLEVVVTQASGNIEDGTLETMQRLQEEFSTELQALDQRVVNLEARTAELEANAFSTTTTLRGEVLFSLEQLIGDDRPGSTASLPQSLTFGSRARLNFDTSFTGRDLLRIRLDALNPPVLNAATTGTNMTRLATDRNNQNDFDLGKFFYQFPVGDNLQLQIDAAQGAYLENLSTYNPGIASGIVGAVSRFGRFNPIYYQGFPGTGVTGTYDFGDSVSLSLGYLAAQNTAGNPEIGVLGGGYTAMAQLDFRPGDTVDLGLTYARSYYPTGGVAVAGGTGSRLANAPFGNIATSADHLGLQSTVRLGPGANLSGWAGLSFAHAETASATVVPGDSATVFNWALTLGLPDLWGKGNLGGLVVGQPPRVTSNSGGRVDGASSWHLEAFYRYRLNQHVSLIPGVFVILNPENSSANGAIGVASLRTVFQF